MGIRNWSLTVGLPVFTSVAMWLVVGYDSAAAWFASYWFTLVFLFCYMRRRESRWPWDRDDVVGRATAVSQAVALFGCDRKQSPVAGWVMAGRLFYGIPQLLERMTPLTSVMSRLLLDSRKRTVLAIVLPAVEEVIRRSLQELNREDLPDADWVKSTKARMYELMAVRTQVEALWRLRLPGKPPVLTLIAGSAVAGCWLGGPWAGLLGVSASTVVVFWSVVAMACLAKRSIYVKGFHDM